MECEDKGLQVDEVMGAALGGGGFICWLEQVESMATIAGGGGRPGVDFIGGGRSGSCFGYEGL